MTEPFASPQPNGGIVLAGPRASGKRTVAFALTSLRRSYASFPALTVVARSPVDAEQTTQRHLDELRDWAQVFHRFTTDGAAYVYDRERLAKLRKQGRVPVACVDDIATVEAFEREAGDWLYVLLWCPRDEAQRRLAAGWSADGGRPTPESGWVRQWEKSSKVLLKDPRRFTLAIRSDHLDAVQIAQIIHLAAQAGRSSPLSASRPGATSAAQTGSG